MAAFRWPSRKARRQKKTDPCAHQVLFHVPALATCTRRSQGCFRDWSTVPHRVLVSPWCSRSVGYFLGLSLRQPEIQNFGVLLFGYENIGWLDIAVHDALGMCGV